jgi:hypothetical protein
MIGAVANKALAYERAFSKIKSPCVAELEGPEPQSRRAKGLKKTVPFGYYYSTPGCPSETVVVIPPSEPKEVARLNVVSYGITPAKKQLLSSWRPVARPGRSRGHNSSRSTR